MMMITLAAVDTQPLYQWIAQVAGSVAVWASTRAGRQEPSPDVEERIQELTLKVRHPWKHRAAKITGWMW